jgi:type III secretory pathway component EscS
MITLAGLWLPIVVSAVIVFVASSLMHMLLKYHQSDYKQLPDEDKLRDTLRPFNLKPGTYVIPFCDHKNMKSPAMTEKYKQGPVGFLTVVPNGPPAMPKFLTQWFLFCLLVGLFVAYLAAHTLPFGVDYLVVFRVVGTAAFLAYGLGHFVSGIWKGQTWSATIKDVVDGLIYGLLTAGTFGWLWPR